MVEKHTKFLRKGADLVYTTEISLLEALTGYDLIVEHLDGKKLHVKNIAGDIVKPGVLKTVKECGMPFFDAPYKYGNLYINFNIVFPDTIDKEQKESLEKLFKNLIREKKEEKYDESYTLSAFDPSDENTHYGGGKKENRRGEEDDDENEGTQGKNMRCAHQ